MSDHGSDSDAEYLYTVSRSSASTGPAHLTTSCLGITSLDDAAMEPIYRNMNDLKSSDGAPLGTTQTQFRFVKIRLLVDKDIIILPSQLCIHHHNVTIQ
jgi:hypothetical protein